MEKVDHSPSAARLLPHTVVECLMGGRVVPIHAFNDIVYAIYDAALTPDNWPKTLSAIGRIFDAEGAVIIFYSGTTQADFIYPPEMRAAVEAYIVGEWWRHDIHAQRALENQLTSGDVFSDQTIATPDEIESLPIWTEFFAQVGFGWLMSTAMLPQLDMLVALSVPRARTRGAFTADEMETLRLLGRHVEQALRISLRISNLETAQDVLLTALDKVDAPIYALDERDRIVLANRPGRERFPEHFDIVDGRMTARIAALRPRFAEIVAAARVAGGSKAPPQSCVLADENGARIAVWALPITASGQGRLGLGGEARTLIIALPVERNRQLDPVVLRDVFDLSLGEARLAALIGAGVPVRDAAGTLGVTEGTARIVLKRVFRKLGVNRQAELVLQLSSLAAIDVSGTDTGPEWL